jgi:predicted acyltransferase
VGVSIVLAYSRRLEAGADKSQLIKKMVIRTLKIFGLGLFLNAFPYFELDTLRIPGVLQRIAIVFFVCSYLFLYTKWKTQAIIGSSLLLLYWFLMSVVPVPGIGPANMEPTTNLAAWVDRLFLEGHMYVNTKVWDPEGFLSTIPAVVTGICGMLTGKLLTSNASGNEKTIYMFLTGSLGIFIGMAWDIYFPINKALWTSSYVLYTAGIGLQILAIIYWMIDVKGKTKGTKPFVVYGSNAITVYVLSGLIAGAIDAINIGDQSLKGWIYEHIYASWLGDHIASLLFADTLVLLLLGVAWILYKKKIFIKV